MDVLNRINAFLAIMFVALLLDFGVSSLSGGDIVGQAFRVMNIGEIQEELNLKITEEMKTTIKRANELYLAGDISGATKEFDKLMEMRVNAGGIISIEKFTELLPEKTYMVFREDEKAKAGFFILSKKGKLIAEEVGDIGRILNNQNAVFESIFYIFFPRESFTIISLNKKKIKVNNKFYYPDIDSKGKLQIKKFRLFWFDLIFDGILFSFDIFSGRWHCF